MTDNARCHHRRCRLYRLFSVLASAGMIRMTNRWPIPCQQPEQNDGT